MKKPRTHAAAPSGADFTLAAQTRRDFIHAAQTRRDFMKLSGVALIGSALPRLGALANPAVHAGGRNTLKIGLLGCGGRGTGAAENALAADPDTELVAVGDVFAEMAQACVKSLKAQESVGARVKVTPETTFAGLDAYKNVIEASDVVLLCTTPAFRPLHLRACIDAGKHVFCEKPVAVDAPGLRSVIETCELAKQKSLSIVSGLCYRYERKKIETLKRIHEGAVGEILATQCTYNTGALWHRGRKPDWSEMEYQIRNWLYFAWLSGDHIAEQHIHSLDKIAWALKDEPPVKCTASGGRACRTDPKFGDVYDHFNTVYEWKNGVKLFSSCRQWQGCATDVSDHVIGTKGIAHIQDHKIEGANPWRWEDRGGKPDDMYQNEHDAFFAALRNNEIINNGTYMCNATQMAIMGRMSAYSGQVVTWDDALHSKQSLGVALTGKPSEAGEKRAEVLDLGKLTLATTPPTPVVAVPGVTKFS